MNPDSLPDWWDPYSCQPYKLPASEKPRTGRGNVIEYLKIAATLFTLGPLVALRYATLATAPVNRPRASDFVGLSVTPDDARNDAVADLVAELGVRRLLVRIPCWEADRIDRYLDFMERLPEREFVVNILQSRDSVRAPDTWQHQVRDIVATLASRVDTFQIGNAINRSKWGCRHSGDWLELMDRATRAVADIDGVRIAGSSVIDFEPLVALRTLFNMHPHRFDICASQLYVNRRGSPFGRQYGVFDLERKIRLLAAMVSVSNKTDRRLWITETNWPLLDTRPWTPNSGHPRSTVNEATQATYLTQYYQIAWRSALVERVYWWQLINPGYGLVDHRAGKLRRMPSFHAFRELLEGRLYEAPRGQEPVGASTTNEADDPNSDAFTQYNDPDP